MRQLSHYVAVLICGSSNASGMLLIRAHGTPAAISLAIRSRPRQLAHRLRQYCGQHGAIADSRLIAREAAPRATIRSCRWRREFSELTVVTHSEHDVCVGAAEHVLRQNVRMRVAAAL